jgi:hypothetical protein
VSCEAHLFRAGPRASIRFLLKLDHILLVVAHHVFHVGAIEYRTVENFAIMAFAFLARVPGVDSFLMRSEGLQFTHAVPEIFHLLIPLLRHVPFFPFPLQSRRRLRLFRKDHARLENLGLGGEAGYAGQNANRNANEE